MNWDARGAIGEVIGALAKFMTPGYLAVPVRQVVHHSVDWAC